MTFEEKLKSGKFVVTCEVGPPKGIDVDGILKKADTFKGKVDAVNVTDLQSAVMRLGSLTMCYLLKTKGHEPIFQLTTRSPAIPASAAAHISVSPNREWHLCGAVVSPPSASSI